MSSEKHRVFEQIMDELDKAQTKFPSWPNDPLHALAIIQEELGELTKEVVQMIYEPHKTTMLDIETEAIQTATMAIRFLLNLNDDKYVWQRGEQHTD